MEQIRLQIDAFYANKQYEQAQTYMIQQLMQAMESQNDAVVLGLLCELMSYYRVHALFAEGDLMATRAVRLLEGWGLTESITAGTVYLNIATLYRVAERYEDSMDFFKRCLAIYQQQLSEQDGRYISLYNNISLLYQEIGQLDQAVEYSERALALILQKDDCEIEVAITYTNLAQMYFQLGERDKGMGLLGQAVALFETHGKTDPHYFATLASLAQSHAMVGEYAEAEALYLDVLGKIEQTFGKNADYQTVYQNYQYVLQQQAPKGEGLALCREYYFAVGKPMIERDFPQLLPYLATGLVGMGSECLGYDDELSRDHDFGPSFCIWLPKEQFETDGKALQQAYDQLPTCFGGVERQTSARGQGRVGVFEIEDFFQTYLPCLPEKDTDWMALEEQSLLMMTSGAVFEDNLGRVTALRNQLWYYPETVRLQKLGSVLGRMAQAGQYNYPRCLQRQDVVAASLALHEFLKATMQGIYLLNRRYQPYYKWTFRGLQDLSQMREQVPLLLQLVQGGNQCETVEKLCQAFVAALKQEGLMCGKHSFLEQYVDEIRAPLQGTAMAQYHPLEGTK